MLHGFYSSFTRGKRVNTFQQYCGRVWRIFWRGSLTGKGWSSFGGGFRTLREHLWILLHVSYLIYYLHGSWKMLYHLLFFTYVLSLFHFILSKAFVTMFYFINDLFKRKIVFKLTQRALKYLKSVSFFSL